MLKPVLGLRGSIGRGRGLLALSNPLLSITRRFDDRLSLPISSIRTLNYAVNRFGEMKGNQRFPSAGIRSFSISLRNRNEASDVGGNGKHQEGEDKTPDKKTNKPSSTVSGGLADVKRLFYLARHDWKMLVLAVSLLTVSCTIGMAVPKVIGLVLDATKNALSGSNTNNGNGGLEDSKSLTLDHLPPIVGDIQLYDFFLLFGGALLIGTMANFGRVVLLKILGERLVARLRSNVIKKTMHHDMEFYDRNKVGDLLSRLGADAYIVSRSMTQNISDGFKALICGGVGIGMMFHISSTLASVLFLFAPPLLVGATIYGNKIRAISRELQQASGNLTKVAEEQLSGIKTVQSFVAEGKEVHRYNNAVRQVFNVGKKEAFTNATFFSSTNVLGDFSFLLVLAYGSHLVLQGNLTIGDLTAFMLYTEYTGSAVFGLSTFYSELMKGAGAATRLFELLDYKPTIKSTTGKAFKPLNGKVEFQHVSFSYPTRKTNQIFKDLNFTIEPGSNVCIVGPSGRGKSTIASLLLRYYNPTSGKILVDGQDITKLSSKSLRRQLGVVQQEPILMSGTIRENITYGVSRQPSMEEIRSVAKKCFCHAFISKFPNGYETIIGPRGALLSGGQKQRIAIARALLNKPKILILDEATSALDVESEGAINYTLGRLMKSKELTIISIAHRLSTIRRSENVIVLGIDGSVVEMGKFKDLYANHDSALHKLLTEPSEQQHSQHQQYAPPAITQESEPQTEENGKDDSGEDQNSDHEENSQDQNEKRLQEEVIHQVLEDISHDQKTSTLRP